MTALVFGASAGLGRALARELAARRENLVLVARDVRDLDAEAAHLKTTYGVSIECVALDARAPESVHKLETVRDFSSIRQLFFPIGMAAEGDDGLLPPETVGALVNANLSSVIATIALFLPGLLAANSGNIVGIGSVAAIRGRGNNVVYAAAKRGLESYFESVRHRTASSSVRTQFYRLGYIDTQMSYGRHMLFPKASPRRIADIIMRNLGKDIGCMTLPSFWVVAAYAVKALPWIIYRRLSF